MIDLLSEIWQPWLAFSLATVYVSYNTILKQILPEICGEEYNHSIIKVLWVICVAVLAPLFILPTFSDRYRLPFIKAFTNEFRTN
jgi:hypothetical protein